MGCIESTPVVEPRTQVIYTTYPVQQSHQVAKPVIPVSNDPINYDKPPPYNPNIGHQPQYYYPYPTNYQVQYVYPTNYNNPAYYRNNQPSTLGMVGAVAGGVIAGEILSDILFD